MTKQYLGSMIGVFDVDGNICLNRNPKSQKVFHILFPAVYFNGQQTDM